MKQQLTQLSNVIACLRTEVNKDLPMQHLAILLAVVDQPGVSMLTLYTQLDMPQGTLSRNVKVLVDQYELLYTERCADNWRQMGVYPTEKCVELMENVCEMMQPENDNGVRLCSCDKKVA